MDNLRRTSYLRELEKWQAHSHQILSETEPEDLFDRDFAERYRTLHGHVWRRIIDLHGTLITLEELEQFPFEYLYGPEMEFWRLVLNNFLSMACIGLHGLVNDTGGDALSLDRLKAEIITAKWRDESKLDLLEQAIRERKFDSETKRIGKRIRAIRNHRIAHLVVDPQNAQIKHAEIGVTLKEMFDLFDSMHKHFGAISFGTSFVTLHGDYMPSTLGGSLSQTSLDELFDAIIRDFKPIHEPETEGRLWAETRKHIDPEELKIMNRLRKRIGLSEA